jgi:hypothetical protein
MGNHHDKENSHVRVSKIITFSLKIFQTFGFEDHFDVGVIFIEPFVTEEWHDDVIKSVAETKCLNSLPT